MLEKIGSGGMAVIYKAEQVSLERLVAIKELRTEVATDRSVVARFQREARCMAAMAHQHIVHVLDFITRGSSMFIVMEYVDGINLLSLMQGVGRLPPIVAAIVALQTSRALEYAHLRGIVHRDLKPSNLMITRQGDVKLMDFGVARDERFYDLTRPGTTVGTPGYMSPEQVLGQDVDGRSDIFSLGIVLYQMLTGVKPFHDDDARRLMHQTVAADYVRPRQVNSDIPRALQRVVDGCLEKRLDRRYQTTEKLRRDLERFVAARMPINDAERLVQYMRQNRLISDLELRSQNSAACSAFAMPAERDHKLGWWPLVRIPATLMTAEVAWTLLVEAARLGR